MTNLITEPIRVLLIDGHAVVPAGLRLLIESATGLKLVGEAGNRTEALAMAAQEQPEIILLDLDVNRDSGLDFLPELLSVANGARVIILTGGRDSEAHRSAINLAALGLLPGEKARAVLTEKSRTKENKKTDPEVAKIATLSKREREVIALVGEGLRSKQIAERLFISEITVRHHLTSIFSKLDVADRFELIIYAYRYKLAHPPSSTSPDQIHAS